MIIHSTEVLSLSYLFRLLISTFSFGLSSVLYMDSEELHRFYTALSLPKEECEVVAIEGSAHDAGVHILEQCLVEEVLTNKAIRFEGFKTTTQQIWRTTHGLKTESLGCCC